MHFFKSMAHVWNHTWQTLWSQARKEMVHVWAACYPALPSSAGFSQGQITSFAESLRARWRSSSLSAESMG